MTEGFSLGEHHTPYTFIPSYAHCYLQMDLLLTILYFSTHTVGSPDDWQGDHRRAISPTRDVRSHIVGRLHLILNQESPDTKGTQVRLGCPLSQKVERRNVQMPRCCSVRHRDGVFQSLWGPHATSRSSQLSTQIQ